MIKHIVMWKVLEGAEGRSRQQNMLEMKRMLEAMPPLIPLIRKLEVGINFLESPMNWDVVLYTEFASREDLIAYDTHPEHEKVKAFVSKIREAVAKVDYDD